MPGRATKLDKTYLYWAARNWARIASMNLNPGLRSVLNMRRRYRWASGFMKANRLMARLMGNRRGVRREVTGFAAHQFVRVFADLVAGLERSPDRVVWHEDLVPPEILYAMDLMPFMVELFGLTLPMLDSSLTHFYLDEAENQGIPPDICMLPRLSLGLAYCGHLPPPIAVVTSNAPCDSGMASYSTYQRLTGRPIFRLDLPHRFKEERAVDYYVDEIKKMIRFLEENTPGRLDWDRLKDVCSERNRAMEHELDLWDLIRHKPAPFGGELIFLGRLVYFTMIPGQKIATETFKKLTQYARRAVQNGDLPEERSRVLLWNPPTFMFPELFSWAEDRFGVSMIMDMLSFNRHPIIDVSSHESMLRDLARIYMQGPMARHTLGPVEYFFDDMFFAFESFSADTIWMAAHQGCKNTQGLLGMLRERCRERGIPLLVLDTDLGDDRIVSADEIKEQVIRFMETIK